MTQFIKNKKLKELNINFFKNYLGFGFQVFFGFLITVIIIHFKGFSFLGVFAQIYAIFVIAGQLSVLGINDSALNNISRNINSRHEENIIRSAIQASVVNGSIFALLLFLNQSLLFNFFQSIEILNNLDILSLTIIFFTVNKVLFSVINGKKLFNYFAFLNFFRPLCILIILSFFVVFDIKSDNAAYLFLFSEVIIFLFIFLYINKIFLINYFKFDSYYFKKHYKFGTKVFFNSFLSESFIRIDVIMLGLFLEDFQVGIYSLAALFFEGIYQFSIVIRNVINPDIAKVYLRNKLNKLININRYSSKLSFFITIVISSIVLILYPQLDLFIDKELVIQSYDILKILIIGIIFYSIIVPEENLLFQTNHPEAQSIYMIILTIVNITLNFIYIKKFGLFGAAIGTTISYCFAVILFNIFVMICTKLKNGVFFKP